VIYRFGAYSVDTGRLELCSSGQVIPVQPQAFALLLFLIENHERVVSKDEIIDNIWEGRSVSDATLNTRINALRRALGDSGESQSVIKTFARRGFRFVAEIENEEEAETGLAPSTNTGDIPSIAVMPFVNISGNPEQEFFADGITEDLVTSMSRIRGFFISGRNSTFSYKNLKTDVRTVSKELGVRYILEGSVRTAGNRVRVSAQLTSGDTGEQLWADRYDRDLTDIFAIQDEVTESVIGQLAPELYAAEHSRLHRKPPQSLDAWECFVRAMHQYSKQSAQSSAEALEYLDRAIKLDAGYAQALGLYAITLSWRVIQRLEPFEESIKKSLDYANLAIAADANEAWAHMGHGMVLMVGREGAKATLSFNRAVELSPNFAYAHAMLGAASAYGGRFDAAIKAIRRAVKLSPRDTFLDKFYLYYSIAYFQDGDYGKAALSAEQAIQLKPEHPNTHMLAAASYALDGNDSSAKAALDIFKNLVPGTNAATVERAIAFENPDDRQRLVNGLRLAGLDG